MVVGGTVDSAMNESDKIKLEMKSGRPQVPAKYTYICIFWYQERLPIHICFGCGVELDTPGVVMR